MYGIICLTFWSVGCFMNEIKMLNDQIQEMLVSKSRKVSNYKVSKKYLKKLEML